MAAKAQYEMFKDEASITMSQELTKARSKLLNDRNGFLIYSLYHSFLKKGYVGSYCYSSSGRHTNYEHYGHNFLLNAAMNQCNIGWKMDLIYLTDVYVMGGKTYDPKNRGHVYDKLYQESIGKDLFEQKTNYMLLNQQRPLKKDKNGNLYSKEEWIERNEAIQRSKEIFTASIQEGQLAALCYCATCYRRFYNMKGYSQHIQLSDCPRTDQIVCTNCSETFGEDPKWNIHNHFIKCLNGTINKTYGSNKFGFVHVENMKSTKKGKFEYIYYQPAPKAREHDNNYHLLTLRKETNKCEYCTKSFLYKEQLLNHIKIHNSEKITFECPICHRVYYKEGKFVKHSMKIHNIKPEICRHGKCIISIKMPKSPTKYINTTTTTT
eukprot:164191_1